MGVNEDGDVRMVLMTIPMAIVLVLIMMTVMMMMMTDGDTSIMITTTRIEDPSLCFHQLPPH